MSVAPSEYHPRYGNAHPEWVQNPVWELAIRNNWTGYRLKEHFNLRRPSRAACPNPSLSGYREDNAGPFWSWERFGRTSTALPDGRVIHIAGEHEDSYDSDFCIYNDVVIQYPGGKYEIYLYPKDVFQPTDFHTATLLGEEILLIGSLSYRDLRRVGETQIISFNTKTLTFKAVASSGDNPGWISRHQVERLANNKLLVVGGSIETFKGHVDNEKLFELDLSSMQWSRRQHGEMSIFNVTADDYRRFKSPAYGIENPERISNPFWFEMAKRDWPPSRARLHFGDFAPPKPDVAISRPPIPDPMPEFGSKEFDEWIASSTVDIPKLTRQQDDVIWTAKRRDPGHLTLSDGRKLVIGGEIDDYGDEYADPWIYNDVIVAYTNGGIAIYAYPLSIFPKLWSWIPVAHGSDVLIFGNVNQKCHPERDDRFVLLSLDTTTFAITPLPISSPPGFRINFYPGCALRQGTSVVFPNVRMTGSDPSLGIAFNLETMTWGEPFPHESPDSTEDDE